MAAGALEWRVGVEEEKFLLVDGRAPRPDEFNAVVEGFARGDAALSEVSTCAGPLLEAALDTAAGPVVVKHDYCTHIVEVAYPPCRSRVELESLHGIVWTRLAPAAEAVGGTFPPASRLGALPDGFTFAETDAFLPRTRRLVARPLPPAALAEPHFLALMAATQVTVELDTGYYFAHLPAAYSLLYLVPFLFPGPDRPGPDAERYRPVRPLLYRDNLPNHPLAGVPADLPGDLDAYRRTEAAIPGRFRDYSFLSLRRPGLVEVRLGDSQPSARATTDLIALLLGILLHASRAGADPDPARTLYDYCEHGALPDRLDHDLRGVEDAIDGLPAQWVASRPLSREPA